jgi:hypothetical protein
MAKMAREDEAGNSSKPEEETAEDSMSTKVGKQDRARKDFQQSTRDE